MDLPHLPPEWVAVLNEMAFSSLSEEGLEQLRQGVCDLEGWYAFESSYALDAAELQQLDNLSFLISELRHGLFGDTAPDLDFLVPRLVQCVRLMDAIRDGRQRTNYTEHRVIDDLIVAAAVWMSGGAEARALHERIPRIEAWKAQLWESYLGVRQQLPDQGRQDLDLGFEAFDEALDEIEQFEHLQEPQQLKDSLAKLVEATQVLHFLVDFRLQFLQKISTTYQRWQALPQIGSTLEHAFERLEQMPPGQRSDYWGSQVRPLWVELSFWWGQQRDMLTLPCDTMEQWVPEVEEQMELLMNLDPSSLSDDATLDELFASVDQLSEGFAQAQASMVSVDYLRGGQAGQYYELIQGLLRNTLPVFTAVSLFSASEPPSAWQPVVDDILNYTKGGPRELLYRAREKLWSLVPNHQQGEGVDHWVCPLCNQNNSLGATTCQHCQGGAGVTLEMKSWDA